MLLVGFSVLWISCNNRKLTVDPISPINSSQKDTNIVQDTSAQLSANQTVSSKPLQEISSLEFINYYDKTNGISLKYPKLWYKETNKYVPFKITAPQEGAIDSMKENFYYAVIDEQSDPTDILKKNKIETMTLEQMTEKVKTDLEMEKSNRKNTKVISNAKIFVNGIAAYEIISVGTINGFDMKYRIRLMKKGSKQYYLYFATEQYTFERYKAYADLLFNSFYIK